MHLQVLQIFAKEEFNIILLEIIKQECKKDFENYKVTYKR